MLTGLFAPKHPITLGRGNPEAIVAQDEDGWWRLWELEMDQAARDAAYEEAKTTEPFFWMPESEWAFLKPGPIVLEAPDRKALAKKIETLEWRW